MLLCSTKFLNPLNFCSKFQKLSLYNPEQLFHVSKARDPSSLAHSRTDHPPAKYFILGYSKIFRTLNESELCTTLACRNTFKWSKTKHRGWVLYLVTCFFFLPSNLSSKTLVSSISKEPLQKKNPKLDFTKVSFIAEQNRLSLSSKYQKMLFETFCFVSYKDFVYQRRSFSFVQ